MPTRREREYYRMGFLDGQRSGQSFEAGIAEERIFEREQLLTRKNLDVNYQHGISLLKQIAESHGLDIRTES